MALLYADNQPGMTEGREFGEQTPEYHSPLFLQCVTSAITFHHLPLQHSHTPLLVEYNLQKPARNPLLLSLSRVGWIGGESGCGVAKGTYLMRMIDWAPFWSI